MKTANNIFKNKTILITGGTGSIGSELVRQLMGYKPQQIRVYARGEFKHFLLKNKLGDSCKNVEFIIGDIRDISRLSKVIKDCDLIFHTAAMKHVSYCERYPLEAIKTNILGSQNVFDLSIGYKVKRVIGISTDKAANPTTMMGATKLVMEKLFTSAYTGWQNVQTRFAIVRFGNILNSNGSVIPLWMDQINSGFDISLTDKRMRRYLMEVSDAAQRVLLATQVTKGREIFVVKMQEKSIYELAQKIIAKHGKGKNISIRIIGKRYGEKLHEELLTDEEKTRMIEAKNFYIVLPNKQIINKRRNSYKDL